MNWEAIGVVTEIIGVLVVVITLAYLAVQLRQNNELLRSESRQALVSNDLTSLSNNIDHADIFERYVSGIELTATDQLRLSFMFALDLRNREFEYFQFTNGILDEESWLTYRNVILINHSTGLGRKWWDEIGREFVDPGFAKQVDELLVNAEPDESYQRMKSWAKT